MREKLNSNLNISISTFVDSTHSEFRLGKRKSPQKHSVGKAKLFSLTNTKLRLLSTLTKPNSQFLRINSIRFDSIWFGNSQTLKSETLKRPMSTSGQPQFRYTQTPSKVLHLRNLPWECTEEELVELCKPFGKIVNTKCNVGANRNQAFVEFVSI